MFCHLNEIPDPPSKFSPDLSPAVNEAISKSLEKDPEDRFVDFRAFSQALDQGRPDEIDDATILTDEDMTVLLDHADLTMAQDEGPEPVIKIKPKKSKKLLFGGIGAAVLIVGALVAFLILKPAPPQQTAQPPPVTSVATSGEKEPAAVVKPAEVKHPRDRSVMLQIPAGEFTMGSDKYSAEKPIQQIFLDPYYIDKYLVTNEKFSKFVEATGYQTDAEKEGAGMVRIGRRWKKVEGANWRMPDGLTGIEGRETHPVSQISYNDGIAYCTWTHKDLPTEAQWEKAARGPNGNEYPWGEQEPNDTMANFDNLIGTTSEVDRFDKGQSVYGVYDMAGNVYQWCKDWYAKGERKAKNPTGPEKGEEKVIKGGSFIEGIESLRSANRDRYPPNYSSFLFGFRCACEEMK